MTARIVDNGNVRVVIPGYGKPQNGSTADLIPLDDSVFPGADTIVDLSGSDEINLPLLFQLTKMYISCREYGVKFIIANPPHSGWELLKMTGLDSMFPAAASVEAALNMVHRSI